MIENNKPYYFFHDKDLKVYFLWTGSKYDNVIVLKQALLEENLYGEFSPEMYGVRVGSHTSLKSFQQGCEKWLKERNRDARQGS